MAPDPPSSAMTEEQEQKAAVVAQDEITIDTPLSDPAFDPTPEQKAKSRARGIELSDHMMKGEGTDPALQSVTETLMSDGTVVGHEETIDLTAHLPDELANAKVVKSLNDPRLRYDISVTVNPITYNVEKHVVVKPNGERTVVSASTDPYGPPRYSVTWGTLTTLAVLVGQFALPLNRMAKLFSTATKKFATSGLSRMLHYVAERLLPIYLELSEQLADSEILSGDDTSSRVIEVSSHFKAVKAAKAKARGGSKKKRHPPWQSYRTPDAAEDSIAQCEERKKQRLRRRADGDREAKPSKAEEPSLGMRIGRALEFESPRQDGTGAKQSLNTTVITGRSIAKDPQSLIVFYRSHLGGFGNLLESVLRTRNPANRDVIVQADLSTTNLVKDPDILQRFNFELIGCIAHARRPFAVYEDEDPLYCPYMLHLFSGIAMHEKLLDEHGRNRDNVLAVRQADSRRLWGDIKELAEEMA
ncbi:MAG: transposase, partial [Lentisphaeria bacterium]|nr:transposase [Lentisphaeria bacterium]